ncbi:MAG: histidine kinase [Eubacteriales bacterium]|nr:histidine kinase [Eubacteriales bacterium]
MKFRSKIIFAYALIAFLVSLAMGVVVGQNSIRYEKNIQKNNLLITTRSYVNQMDENLGRMDAIMQYILSNQEILESITLLAKDSQEELPVMYVREAESAIRVGLSTSYIMKNSYRTVFVNDNSFLASSVIYTPDADVEIPNNRLNTEFRLEDISYLEDAAAVGGKSVIVTEHQDPWGDGNHEKVYSLVKALRGEGMGYLEVESRMDTLDSLKSSDEDIEFLILVNGDELLYTNSGSGEELLSEKSSLINEQLVEETVLEDSGDIYTKVSSDQFALSVLAFKRGSLMGTEYKRIFLSAFLAAMVVFCVSLLFIIFLSNVLVRPVKRLQKVVESTNMENLQENWNLKESVGPDEFQELTNSFQYMAVRLNTALRNEKRAAMLQLQAQFDTLQTQVNPHFIFNVLNIISSHAVMDNDEVICEMCGALGNMLRYSTNTKERYASVEKEIEYLNSYFYLLKARYENRLEVSVDIDSRIREQIIPKMTLQQLVENCIQHGFHDTDVPMYISVTGTVLEDRWMIRVQDNGSGIKDEKLKELKKKLAEVRKEILEQSMSVDMEIGGMGLANTYARCLLIYFEDLIFEIENVSDGPGFLVTVGQRTPKK